MVDVAIVGEAWGEAEERTRTAFTGGMSRELTPMLEEAGIHRADCFLTNVFNLRYDGKIDLFCGGKKEGIPGYGALSKSKYCRQEFQPELDRLAQEMVDVDPNIIIAMGNTPLWAFMGSTGITKFRGSTFLSTHTATGFKVLPTYHPAAIMHQWELRPTTVLDLAKAARESKHPNIIRPVREIWIEPSLEDILEYRARYIDQCSILSVDIETVGERITCIGFAGSPSNAIVIPFDDSRRKSRSYWPTVADESRAWSIVREILMDGKIKKLFQNGLYDISFLWRAYGIRVMGMTHDSMLLHHSLQPESLKSLGFLGSIYTSESAWKHMRQRAKTTIKQDD